MVHTTTKHKNVKRAKVYSNVITLDVDRRLTILTLAAMRV